MASLEYTLHEQVTRCTLKARPCLTLTCSQDEPGGSNCRFRVGGTVGRFNITRLYMKN